MTSLADYKNKLGSYGEHLTEEQIEQLYNWEYRDEGTISAENLGEPDKNETRQVGLGEELLHNISKEEYRELLDDYKSSDEQIEKRLKYLGSFCRNIIRMELQQYVEKNRKKIKH